VVEEYAEEDDGDGRPAQVVRPVAHGPGPSWVGIYVMISFERGFWTPTRRRVAGGLGGVQNRSLLDIRNLADFIIREGAQVFNS
jgi:hypothetical protein